MSFSLECKKVKRTGFIPIFLVGGLLSASIPIVNMAARSQIYVELESSPVQILIDANWQMMAMLNVLLLVVGSCLMYQAEYAEHAIQKMWMLPIKEHEIFFGKTILIAMMGLIILTFESVGVAFCSIHWFDISSDFILELLKSFGYAFVLMLPSALLSLLIASFCQNMWVSLGIGVICVFMATLLPTSPFILSIFPFAMPFQTFVGATGEVIQKMLLASAFESIIIVIVEIFILRVRRFME